MDHRDLARALPARLRASTDGTRVLFLLDDDEGDAHEYELPLRFEVCATCEGRGSHVNPSIDSGGISPGEFDDDPDFAEGYFAGRYDVACYQCGGQRVVPVVDRDRLNDTQRALAARLDKAIEDDRLDAIERESERRRGC